MKHHIHACVKLVWLWLTPTAGMNVSIVTYFKIEQCFFFFSLASSHDDFAFSALVSYFVILEPVFTRFSARFRICAFSSLVAFGCLLAKNTASWSLKRVLWWIFFRLHLFFCDDSDAFLPPASSDLRGLAKWKPFWERQNKSGYLKESIVNLANLAQLSAAPLGRSRCGF